MWLSSLFGAINYSTAREQNNNVYDSLTFKHVAVVVLTMDD